MVVVGLVVGGGGLELRLSPCATEELDAVDVVSCVLAVVSLGSMSCEAFFFESIPVARLWATSILNVRSVCFLFLRYRFSFVEEGGICRVLKYGGSGETQDRER